MSTAPHTLTRLLGSLDPREQDRLADAYAARARDHGLLYLSSDGSRPIPVVFPPVIERRSRTTLRAQLARSITAAVASASRALLGGALGASLAEELLSELAPVERAIVESRHLRLDRLATVRADLFEDASGKDRLLELNTTIPAMQAYSDIAARSFVEACLEVLARKPAESAAPILEANGSNSDDLLRSLLACYREEGGASAQPSIALVHRPNDSQLAELRYLAAHFRSKGYAAETVEAGDLQLGSDGRLRLEGSGEHPDILYRHIFAALVDPDSDFAAILRAPDGHALFNPVSPHLEQKATLAEVSAAATDPARASLLGIDPTQAALIRRHVPWTRRLRPGPSTDPTGGEIADLPDFVIRGQAGLVLKRSWDFGGKGVFLGEDYDDPSSQARALARFGAHWSALGAPGPSGPLVAGPSSGVGWSKLVDACLQEGGWIVQERVPLHRHRVILAAGNGAVPDEVFIDISSFTNLGTSPAAAPQGGVCRASRSAIVNIQSGGGVVPLLAKEAADSLVDALTLR